MVSAGGADLPGGSAAVTLAQARKVTEVMETSLMSAPSTGAFVLPSLNLSLMRVLDRGGVPLVGEVGEHDDGVEHGGEGLAGREGHHGLGDGHRRPHAAHDVGLGGVRRHHVLDVALPLQLLVVHLGGG